MSDDRSPVRPTKRCLDDLGIKAPVLTEPLHALTSPIVRAAQQTPETKKAGGAERIRSLTDRVWFKCRMSNQRAIVTELQDSEIPPEFDVKDSDSRWWIGAAGYRQSDSHHDFYKAIERECTVGATVSSTHLLPGLWDVKRLVAEQALAWRLDVKRMVIRIIATSLRTGHVAVAEYSQHRIQALVRAEDGNEAYLAIVADGVPDPNVFALILDCVPGISTDDWQPEPGGVSGISPKPGQIIWSTVFPAIVAAGVLEADEDD